MKQSKKKKDVIKKSPKENEGRFELFSRAINEVIYEWDLVSKTAWVNDLYQTLFGYSDIKTDFDWWFKKVHPDDKERVKKSIFGMIKGDQQSWSCEYRYQRADGSYAFVFDRSFVVRDESGKPIRIIGAIIDITQRKQAEEALKRSEATLRYVLAAAPVDIFLLSADRKFLWGNDKKDSISGYKLNELGNGPEKVFISEEEYDRVGEVVYSKVWKGETGETDTKWIHKDGRILDIHISVVAINPNDKSAGVVFIAKDITERKQAEEALKRSEATLMTVLAAAPIDISFLSADRKYIWGNDLKSSMTGYILNDFGNDPRKVFLSEEEYNRVGEVIYNKVWKGGISETDTKWIHKDGSVIDIHISVAAVNPNDKSAGVVCTAKDITERKQAEEALKRSEATMRTLFAAAPIGISLLTAERKIIWINDYMSSMAGYTMNELKNRSINDVYETEDEFIRVGDAVYCKVWKGEIAETDTKWIHKDGRILDIHVSVAAVDCNDRSAGIVFTAQDITWRKSAEEALKRSEATMRSIFAATPIGISLITESRKISWVNEWMRSITGHTLTEIEHDTKNVYISEEEFKRVGEVVYRKVWNGEVGETDTKWMHKDGRILDIHVSAAAVDYNDRSAGIVFTAQDITWRKRAEEALRESENQFRDLAEKALVGIYVIQDGVFKYVNSWCAKIHGYEIGELIDEKTPFDMLLPEDLPIAEINRASRISGDAKSLHHQFRIVTKTGEIRYVETRSTFTMFQGRSATIGTILDVTERKQAEEALRISEEKYHNIFNRSVEGLFQCTFDGRFINVNPSFVSMLGYKSAEELIVSITDINNQLFVIPEERITFTKTLKKNDTIVGFEHQFYRKDRTKIWITTTARVVRNQEGKILTYEGASTDITRNKQAEAEKEKLQSDLRQAQKMEAIGTFVGGIAHDFNNMLSVMMGYGSLLQTGLTIDNPMRKFADLIVTSSEKAASLTRGLLSFSRKQPVDLKNIILNDVIRGTKNLLKTLLTEDIILKEKLTQDETIIMGDLSQIDQILFNLATNSRDAMPQGGTLTIETKLMNLDRYVLGYDKPGKYIMLSVSDTGIGMDNNIKEHIFNPFFTTKEVGKGTGLGLSTVYGIVKQHNGYISVYSEPNVGTTFHIYFPVISESVKEEKPALPKLRKGHETILVAEDSDSVRQLIKTILSSYGYLIIEAADGEDAIAKFKKTENIDLVIIDTIMPKKNGREVYDEVIKINPRIKTLFTSGYTRDVILDKGIEEKEFNFLQKPITPNELIQKVGDILDEK